jgi:hypothetical protein
MMELQHAIRWPDFALTLSSVTKNFVNGLTGFGLNMAGTLEWFR